MCSKKKPFIHTSYFSYPVGGGGTPVTFNRSARARLPIKFHTKRSVRLSPIVLYKNGRFTQHACVHKRCQKTTLALHETSCHTLSSTRQNGSETGSLPETQSTYSHPYRNWVPRTCISIKISVYFSPTKHQIAVRKNRYTSTEGRSSSSSLYPLSTYLSHRCYQSSIVSCRLHPL